MKKLRLILVAFCLLLSIISSAQPILNYRFTNPRIIRVGGFDNFEFDIQVKASVGGTLYWAGQCIINFNNAALTTTASQWIVTKAPAFAAFDQNGNPKYTIVRTITSSPSVLNIGVLGDINSFKMDPIDPNDFVIITTSYQNMITVRGRISSISEVAGLDFKMIPNQQSYIPEYNTVLYYADPVAYESGNFLTTYLGRLYSTFWGWSQAGNTGNAQWVDWTTPVNTSIWEGAGTITGGAFVSNASALRIHSPATLTIPVNGKLTVTGETDVATANGLTILSDATGTGSLITGSATGAGSAVDQRYMTSGAWHIVSAPLIQTVGNFLTSNSNIATNSVSGARGIIDYNPVANVWNAPAFTNLSPESLGAGKGFSMRVTANGIVTFAGSLQAGAQPVPTASGYWNCIGNPYTSAIGMNSNSTSGELNNFLTVNAAKLDPLNGAIYVWEQPDASNGQSGKYTTFSNASAGVDFQQGQAFLVKLGATATSVDYTNPMQIHSPGLPLKSTATTWPTIKLKATIDKQSNVTTIAFNSAMTRGLDPTYDAGLLKGSTDLVVYSKLVDDIGIPFAIQALPDNGYSTMIIPIGIDSKTGGDVVFSSETMNLPVNCKVVLEDKLTKTFTDLTTNVYNVTIAANSSISDRFQLHTSDLMSGLNDKTGEGLLNAYAVKNIEIRIVGNVSNDAVATLYDVQGKVILIANLKEGSLNVIPTPNIKPAIYMLSVKDNSKLQTFKLLLRE